MSKQMEFRGYTLCVPVVVVHVCRPTMYLHQELRIYLLHRDTNLHSNDVRNNQHDPNHVLLGPLNLMNQTQSQQSCLFGSCYGHSRIFRINESPALWSILPGDWRPKGSLICLPWSPLQTSQVDLGFQVTCTHYIYINHEYHQ